MAKSKAESIRDRLNESIKAFDDFEKSISTISDRQRQLDALQESYADRQRLINDLQANYNKLKDEQKAALDR